MINQIKLNLNDKLRKSRKKNIFKYFQLEYHKKVNGNISFITVKFAKQPKNNWKTSICHNRYIWNMSL